MQSPKGRDVVRLEGELLVVSHGARLAGACVKCASCDGLRSRCGLMHHERMGNWLLNLAGVIGLVVAAYRQRTAAVVLPICGACEARWNRAVRVRRRSAGARDSA
jgi:hypothetical protein